MSNLHLTKVPLCLGLLATPTSHFPVPLLSQHPESKGTDFKTVYKQAVLSSGMPFPVHKPGDL